ncbi:COMM domain-containing protein 4-like [Corticium candelabrum]|uniref:COMM domain-containing protein 4-like n=1 Tax=Corticium candelabrum TaxID=121492 RepID=UPI002E267428|nr:COMM domain-containing protein 4-like [Corticium candelabrum]
MKFRFCGDLDCPDWVLAEISILSRLTSVKMKLLCNQIVQDLVSGSMDYTKVFKITADAKFEMSDVKAAVAALMFIVSSAAKYNVDSESLSSELQQLGLPKESSTSLCKSYGDGLDKLQKTFRDQSLRLSRFHSVDWRVDYVISSSEVKAVEEPCVQLKVNKVSDTTGDVESTVFALSPTKFRLLLSELKQAQTIMDSMTT